MRRDNGDILDRWSISKLKAERIGAPESIKEYEAFNRIIEQIVSQSPDVPWELFKKEMLNINSTIWFLEAALKSGKEILPNPIWLADPTNKDCLAEIGKTSLLIRNINSLRVGLKNILNTITHDGFVDIKHNHASA